MIQSIRITGPFTEEDVALLAKALRQIESKRPHDTFYMEFKDDSWTCAEAESSMERLFPKADQRSMNVTSFLRDGIWYVPVHVCCANRTIVRKYVARPDTWFKAGSEVRLIDDYRPQASSGLFEGVHVISGEMDASNRGLPVGAEVLDQKVCPFDEFDFGEQSRLSDVEWERIYRKCEEVARDFPAGDDY